MRTDERVAQRKWRLSNISINVISSSDGVNPVPVVRNLNQTGEDPRFGLLLTSSSRERSLRSYVRQRIMVLAGNCGFA